MVRLWCTDLLANLLRKQVSLLSIEQESNQPKSHKSPSTVPSRRIFGVYRVLLKQAAQCDVFKCIGQGQGQGEEDVRHNRLIFGIQIVNQI
jgi:hypothetical protein